jgi:hypothetical protein
MVGVGRGARYRHIVEDHIAAAVEAAEQASGGPLTS